MYSSTLLLFYSSTLLLYYSSTLLIFYASTLLKALKEMVRLEMARCVVARRRTHREDQSYSRIMNSDQDSPIR